ncbi:MAG: hypothetical protein HYU66_24285 [Armatimonadetes bacterium]|nr:hypothetical protein [Armatimonadota bacterium]
MTHEGVAEAGSAGPAAVFAQLDTGRGSLVWEAAPEPPDRAGGHASPWSYAGTYVWAVLVTYGPILLLTALFSGWALLPRPGSQRLYLLGDVNAWCIYFLTFPVALVLLRTDRSEIPARLARVIQNGALSCDAGVAESVKAEWEERFTRSNRLWTRWGLVMGLVGAANNVAYILNNNPVDPTARFGAAVNWTGWGGRGTAAGWYFCLTEIPMCLVWILFIGRFLTTSSFLSDVVGRCRVNPLALHPDRCAGLAPLGGLWFRYATMLAIVALNMVTQLSISFSSSFFFYETCAQAALVLFVLPPVALLPLVPFRRAMSLKREQVIEEVAVEYRRRFESVTVAMKDGSAPSREDVEALDQLRKLRGLAEEMPVWPIDVATARRGIGVHLAPVVVFLAEIAKSLAKLLAGTIGKLGG